MKDPFIFRVLDVSTCHMTKDDANRLEDPPYEVPIYGLQEFGWLAYIGEIEDNWSKMSEAFVNVMKKAKELGCDYVRFDRDGREYPELSSFDW